ALKIDTKQPASLDTCPNISIQAQNQNCRTRSWQGGTICFDIPCIKPLFKNRKDGLQNDTRFKLPWISRIINRSRVKSFGPYCIPISYKIYEKGLGKQANAIQIAKISHLCSIMSIASTTHRYDERKGSENTSEKKSKKI
ncbi:9440_t:CDS:2, partial [Gigaspora margarita]